MESQQQAEHQPRRFLIISDDAALAARLREGLPAGWGGAIEGERLENCGDWNDILLFRFVLLDLDAARFDPLRIVDTLRHDYLLNIPIHCFGGDAARRERLRQAGANRFFDRSELERQLPRLLAQHYE